MNICVYIYIYIRSVRLTKNMGVDFFFVLAFPLCWYVMFVSRFFGECCFHVVQAAPTQALACVAVFSHFFK